MSTNSSKLRSIAKVFRALGLETEGDRNRFRLLNEFGAVIENCYDVKATTRNNTARDDYAELEPTPE